jgi:hypothetical protein
MPAVHLIVTDAVELRTRVLACLQRWYLPADACDVTEYITRKPDGSRDLVAEADIRDDVELALERLADEGLAVRVNRNRTTLYMGAMRT